MGAIIFWYHRMPTIILQINLFVFQLKIKNIRQIYIDNSYPNWQMFNLLIKIISNLIKRQKKDTKFGKHRWLHIATDTIESFKLLNIQLKYQS